MKVTQYLAYIVLATSATNAASIPEARAISLVEDRVIAQPRSADVITPDHSLERRKGGGGRGGGSSGGSSSGSSGGSSGGGRSGSSGSGGSSSGSSGRTSSSSSAGGSTRSGSGAPRAYGGGYYGGGASVPYSAGSRTPKGLVAAPLLVGVGLLAIMPGLWLYSVYPYHFSNPYRFYNQSDVNSTNPNGTNTTLPVTCLCQEYSPCGCDENEDQKYLNDLVGNGSYPALNKSLVTVSDVDGTRTLVLNGTLPNGTTAPGGTDDSAALNLKAGKYAGYWVMATIVLTGVML